MDTSTIPTRALRNRTCATTDTRMSTSASATVPIPNAARIPLPLPRGNARRIVESRLAAALTGALRKKGRSDNPAAKGAVVVNVFAILLSVSYLLCM